MIEEVLVRVATLLLDFRGWRYHSLGSDSYKPKTLNLYNKDGYYNLAGELLADHNEIGFSGIDIVKFGKDISQIQFRKTITNRSLLTQFDMAIELFEQYYIFEEIDGYNRTKKERIPKEAFRESLANAIVHRLWDINSFIQIAMYEDQIEINKDCNEHTYCQAAYLLSKRIFEKIIDKLRGLAIKHFPGHLAVKKLIRLVAGAV